MINKDGLDSFMTDEVLCPHCLYEYSDSWEFPEWVEEYECCECNKKFSIERNIEIAYVTVRINE